MNFKNILTIIFVIFGQIACASPRRAQPARLGGKGNMRGLYARSSGLSPRQMVMLRKRMDLVNRRKYGRFA